LLGATGHEVVPNKGYIIIVYSYYRSVRSLETEQLVIETFQTPSGTGKLSFVKRRRFGFAGGRTIRLLAHHIETIGYSWKRYGHRMDIQ